MYPVLRLAAEGRISEANLEWKDKFAVCVVLATERYPIDYGGQHLSISGLNQAEKEVQIYHSGTKLKDGKVVADRRRVIGVIA